MINKIINQIYNQMINKKINKIDNQIASQIITGTINNTNMSLIRIILKSFLHFFYFTNNCMLAYLKVFWLNSQFSHIFYAQLVRSIRHGEAMVARAGHHLRCPLQGSPTALSDNGKPSTSPLSACCLCPLHFLRSRITLWKSFQPAVRPVPPTSGTASSVSTATELATETNPPPLPSNLNTAPVIVNFTSSDTLD